MDIKRGSVVLGRSGGITDTFSATIALVQGSQAVLFDFADGSTGTCTIDDQTFNVTYLFPSAPGDGTVSSTVEINDDTANGPDLSNEDHFGPVSSIGDLDNDGTADLAVGSPGGYLSSSKGAVHILFMNSDGTVKSTVEIDDDTTNGPDLSAGDQFGRSVAGIGDLDNDGTEDIAVGACCDFTSTGAVYVLLMNSDGTVKSTVEIDDDTTNGPDLNNGDWFGFFIAGIGDLDNDGTADIAVGATGDDAGDNNAGALHILFMNSDGTVKSTVEIDDDTTNGPDLSAGDNFGRPALIGDLDNDGTADIAVGATGDATAGVNAGALHILFMNSDGTVKSTVEIDDDTTNGPDLSTNDFFGTVAGIGDLDNDGTEDLVVGAASGGIWAQGTSKGAVYILLLNSDGTVRSTVEIDDDTTNGPTVDNADLFGDSVAAIGDLDGNGVADIAVGAIGDDAGGTDRGAMHVLFMDATAPLPAFTHAVGTANTIVLTWNKDNMDGTSITAGDFVVTLDDGTEITAPNLTVAFNDGAGPDGVDQTTITLTSNTIPSGQTPQVELLAGQTVTANSGKFVLSGMTTASVGPIAPPDTTAPTVAITAPASNSVSVGPAFQIGYTLGEAASSGTITFTHTSGTADSSSPHSYTIPGTKLASGANTVTLSDAATLVNGAIYTIKVEATDSVGNTGSHERTAITYDTTALDISSASPAASSRVGSSFEVGYTLGAAASSGTITFTRTGGAADSNSPHEYTMVSGDLGSGAQTVSRSTLEADADFGPLVDGVTYTMVISATTSGGTSGTHTATGVTYDTTSPTVTITAPASNSVSVGPAFQIGYTLSEAASSGTITFTRTGGTADSGSPHTHAIPGAKLAMGANTVALSGVAPALADGAVYTITVSVTDPAGNTGSASQSGITYDTTDITPPTVSITAPAAGPATVGPAYGLGYSLSEPATSGTVTFTHTGGSPDGAQSHTYVMRPADLAEGDRSVAVGSMGLSLVHGAVYTVAVSVTDLGGNAGSAERTGIRYDNLPTQVTSVTISSSGPDPTRAGVGDTITVTAKVSEPVRFTDVSTGIIAGRGSIWDVSDDTITMYSTIRAGLEDHDREGPVKFSFLLSDDFGNTGTVNRTTDGSSVVISFMPRPSHQPEPPPTQPEPPAPPPTQPEPPSHSPPVITSVTISSDNIDPELADVNNTITVTATLSGPISASDVSSCMIAMADATCTVSGSTITMHRTLDGHEYEGTALFSFILFEGTDDQVTVDDTTDGSSVGIHFFALHCTPWSRLPWC